ncbi:Nif3-like dinuclear metal center hexameric protein [candidate division WWE3 bacterium CG06_land_8_20_14_3_00_42_16]|uniref:GTP cyclohydrolase 1 type 2 homolog n=1 Tax=candidate division WWE3 bacterium CG06_land_8_20_14_3_00_42_16 TaxID=1975083 RepID=A0A2M7APB9_UNCKA|nr:MAG: Nif3-like dinuclear metal center hexameric protein [candidate division WWE3 bacterium CG06_land_8_20_14_3_00_42_16]
MKVQDIVKVIQKIAPPELAYEGEEMGFIVGDENKEISVIGVTERPTVKVLREAVENKVDMLIIHEPLYQSKKSFLVDAALLKYPPNQKREKLVKQGGFCIYRLHSEWDEAKDGNNDTLAKLLEIEVTDKLPYGRIGKIKSTSLEQFAESVKKSLECKNVLVVGDKNKTIGVVAIVAGSGNSLTEIIELSKQKGADVLVSGDVQDSRARFASELDLAMIDAGDYFTENPGAKRLAEVLQNKLTDIKVLHLDPGAPWEVI